MIQNVFDLANRTAPVSVRTDPGRIIVGHTNFIEPGAIEGLELSPIQAAMLVLALTNAISAEIDYSTAWEKERTSDEGGDEFL
jgi:hypothetical protein